MNEITEKQLTAAEKMYQSHLKNVARYQKNNADKMKEKQRRYKSKLKTDAERYEISKQKRRKYYNDVLKPRKQARLQELQKEEPTSYVIEIRT